MKRVFALESSSGRRLVALEVTGARLRVAQKNADGTTKRSEKELAGEAEARAECDRLARDLTARGFVEQTAATSPRSRPAAPKPAAAAVEPEGLLASHLFDDDGASDAGAEPVLPRLAAAPAAAESEPKGKKANGKGKGKAKGKGKRKKRSAEPGDALDKRVLAGIGAVGLAIVMLGGYVAYDAFIKPPSIVGVWAGSMIDFEIGKPMVHTQYRLVLDPKRRASMTLQEKFTSVGTYALKGNLITLNLKAVDDDKDDEDEGGEDMAVEREYKFALGRATLDLFDPSSGKKLVQLIRFRETPVVGGAGGGGGGGRSKPPAPPADVAGPVDEAADAKLASVAFAPKDGAFRLRHPAGWEAETGSRPDNTYSWAKFTKGSAQIDVYADVQGSLMSGSDSNHGQHEEGSEFAPVHAAHELYRKTAADEFSDYSESKPVLFKGSSLGEGRIATFRASGGGLLGSKLRGYRATMLTNDRRVTVLCRAPETDFAGLKPTFLAVCRSLSR